MIKFHKVSVKNVLSMPHRFDSLGWKRQRDERRIYRAMRQAYDRLERHSLFRLSAVVVKSSAMIVLAAATIVFALFALYLSLELTFRAYSALAYAGLL